MATLALIIPCYNKANYLVECLNSVMQQTRIPDEIVIVDDCSTDGTRELILEIASTNSLIKPVLAEKNGGVSAARNIGVKNSCSEYITFLDADDILWNPQKLENEMAIVEKMEIPTLVYSLTRVLDESGKLSLQEKDIVLAEGAGLLPYFIAGKYLTQYVPRDYCISRRVFIDSGGFDETMNYYEDYDLLIRLSQSCVFICTKEEGTGYRQTNNGLSSQAHNRHVQTIKKLRKKYYGQMLVKDCVKFWCCLVELFSCRALRKIARKLGIL